MNKFLVLSLVTIVLLGAATTFVALHDGSDLSNASCAKLVAQSGKYYITNTCNTNEQFTLVQPNVDYDKTFTSDCLTASQGEITTIATNKKYTITQASC